MRALVSIAVLIIVLQSRGNGIRLAEGGVSSLFGGWNVAATSMPAACVASPSTPVAASNAQFQLDNEMCLRDFDECVTSNRSACAATCDNNLANFGYDCRAGNGAFCRYQAFSHSGSVTNDRPFVMRSAICLPAGCGRDQTVQVEAFLRQQRCGPLANSLDCQLTLTCDFGLTSGAIIGIVVGVVIAFCAVVAGGIVCSHCCDDDEDEVMASNDERGSFRMPSFIIDDDDAGDADAERGQRRSSPMPDRSQNQRRLARSEWSGSDDDADSIGSIVGQTFLVASRQDDVPDHDGL